MDYKLNFSFLDANLLQQDKITIQEITQVFNGETNHTIWLFPSIRSLEFIIT